MIATNKSITKALDDNGKDILITYTNKIEVETDNDGRIVKSTDISCKNDIETRTEIIEFFY